MKTSLFLTIVCLGAIWLISCTSQNNVAPTVDQRDQHIGLYACEVTIENFNTKQVFSTYRDTLTLSKQGERELLVNSRKSVSLPILQVSPPYAYFGQFTNLVIQRDTLNLTSGPDAKFYVYKGYKLK